MKAALLLLLATSLCRGIFAQGSMKQRLVAQALYSDTNSLYPGHVALSDSLVLGYSGARHSEFDYSNMNYFDLSRGSGNSSLTAKVNAVILPNNFDSALFALRLSFDTLRYYDCTSGSPQLSFEEGAKYLADGKCDETYYKAGQSLLTKKFRYALGRLMQESGAEYRNGVAGATHERFISYDASGNAAIDSAVTYGSGQVSAASVSKFVFDGSGYYTSWLRQSGQYRTRYTYYADGKVQTRTVDQAGAGGTFVPQYLDSLSYTPGLPGYTGRKSFVSFNGSWFPNGDVHFHINPSGQKDSMIVRGAGPQQADLYFISYNGFGNPETCTHDAYYDGDFLYRNKTFYYYETYDPALSVQGIAEGPFSVTLSPNPAGASISLRFNAAIPDGHVAILISNALGQYIYSERRIGAGGVLDIRLGNELAAGLYYIRISGTGKALLYTGTFLKQ